MSAIAAPSHDVRLCRDLDAVNDRIVLLLLRDERALREIAERFAGRA